GPYGLRGWRLVRVTERRTKVDWAYALQDILTEHYPEAEKIILVMDNLNTHSPSSFYEAFDAIVSTLLAAASFPRIAILPILCECFPRFVHGPENGANCRPGASVLPCNGFSISWAN